MLGREFGSFGRYHIQSSFLPRGEELFPQCSDNHQSTLETFHYRNLSAEPLICPFLHLYRHMYIYSGKPRGTTRSDQINSSFCDFPFHAILVWNDQNIAVHNLEVQLKRHSMSLPNAIPLPASRQCRVTRADKYLCPIKQLCRSVSMFVLQCYRR